MEPKVGFHGFSISLRLRDISGFSTISKFGQTMGLSKKFDIIRLLDLGERLKI